MQTSGSLFVRSLISVTLLLLVKDGGAAAFQSKYCPAMARPVSRSIKNCWEDTQTLMSSVASKFSVKKEVCLDEHQTLLSNKQIGLDLMGTFETIYCFGKGKHQDLGYDSIQTINAIHRSISEIIDSPDVCVPDMDFPSVNCFTEIDLDDFDILYHSIVRQVSLLERLSMSLQVAQI